MIATITERKYLNSPMTAMKYPGEDFSKMYESIDDILTIIGSKRGFSMHNTADNVHTYSFPDGGTAVVFVPNEPTNNAIAPELGATESGAIYLLNFTNDSYKGQVIRALKDLDDIGF